MKVCSACKRCFDDPAESCVEFSHPQLTDSRPGHPLMVPDYSLDQLLDAVNKADVYIARRLDCDRRCLIKIVSSNTQDGEAFLRDAGLASGIFDARVADIYESGTLESGKYFVVEEFEEGQTLRGHLDTTGTPELLTTIRVVEQVAEALHALHLNGLIHGAVRPNNIFLNFDDEGRPAIKLSGIDLGGVIARNVVSNKFLIDSALGSIRYFAPEQCSGAPSSAQTDIYSLGVVLYELLVGVPPFDAPKAVALMDMHRTQRPAEVMIDDLELRMLVAHSLSESLQKQPGFRQSSADLFARQMRHIEQLATHVSTPPPAVNVPVLPSMSPNAISNRPLISKVPAIEPARDASFGTAFARGFDTTFDIENEPAAPTFAPKVANHDIDGPPVVFEVTLAEADEPMRSLNMATSETDSEQRKSVDLPGAELPIRIASALTERRHRLKRLRRTTGPVEEPEQETPTQPESDPESDLISRLGQSVAFDFSQPVEEESAVPAIMPRLIDWYQPDDIPSLDEAEAVASSESTAFDLPFSAPYEEPVATPIAARPILVEWKQPADDIPSIEDVIEARSVEEVTAVRAVAFTPEDSNVVAAIQRRLNSEVPEPTETPNVDTAIVSVPPKAIDVTFAPTILGERRRQDVAHPRPQIASILDAYEVPPRSSSVPYRSIGIGLLLMTVATVIGLGGDPVWQYFSAPEQGTSVAEMPSREKRISVEPTRSAKVDRSDPESETPAAFTGDIPAYDGPAPTAERPKPSSSKTRPRGQIRRGTASSEAPRAENNPFAASTLVITYGNGGVQSANSAHKNSREKPARPASEKAAGATRPRIVAVPRR